MDDDGRIHAFVEFVYFYSRHKSDRTDDIDWSQVGRSMGDRSIVGGNAAAKRADHLPACCWLSTHPAYSYSASYRTRCGACDGGYHASGRSAFCATIDPTRLEGG